MAWSDCPGICQLKRWWLRLQQAIAQDVPERVAKCEFDCERTDCAPDAIRDCHPRFEYEQAERSRDEAAAAAAPGASTPPDT